MTDSEQAQKVFFVQDSIVNDCRKRLKDILNGISS